MTPLDGDAPALPGRPVYRLHQLARLLRPASIAIVGASPRPGSFGERLAANLADYTGTLYLVNGKYDRIGERACHKSVAALPSVPDCVVITAARDAVEQLVRDCVAAGVGGVVVFASGYAETGKPDRVALQDRLAGIVRGTDTRLVGPNCIGVTSYAVQARMTFAAVPASPVLRAPAVALVSQSGALGHALAQASHRGMAVTHVLTSGNSADVDMADYVAALAEDPSCNAIACLFEGMAAPLRMVEAAELAWQADKPVIVYKMATGEQGAAAAMSHTGSLAGSNAAYRAAFERAGIIMVDNYEDLMETASFFAKAPRPRASGVAVVATSGGAAIIAADKAEQHGVPLPQPAPETRAVLEKWVPEFGSPRNPCDVTAQVVNDPNSLRACAEALLADPAYGVLVVPQAYAYEAATVRLPVWSELASRYGKFVCNVWMPEWLDGPGARESEADPNIALFHSMSRCFAALGAWHRREERRTAPSLSARLAPPGAAEAAARLLRAAPHATLAEREAKAVLALYGVQVVGETVAATEDEAVQAAQGLGGPVAMKVESPDIPHKTEAGVVRLGVQGEDAVRAAYRLILGRAQALTRRIAGVLVQPMVPHGVEMVVGARVDPQFGALLVVGLGGVMVELLKDVQLAPVPVDPAQAEAMLRRLRGFALLDGFRGSERVSLPALVRVICLLSECVADHAAQITEMDVNPLICAGNRIVAVDALIVRRGE